jgi:hypothetical protein
MLSERKKKTIVLTLALISFLLNMIFALPFDSVARVFYRLRLYYWGWIPAFILPLVAIVLTLCWRPGGKMLRAIILFLSVIAILLAGLLFFGLYFISHLNP